MMTQAGHTSAMSWVSKSDVIAYRRCPRAWWLVATGQIDRLEALTPFQRELAAVGQDFEAGVVAAAEPVTIPPGTEREFFRGQRTVYSSQLFRNEPLRLLGRPDGIVSAGGAVEPVEIKSHRSVRHSDRIELAFYWRLLEPLRSVEAAPAGWLDLPSPDGQVTRTRVLITDADFAELDATIRAVRQARIHGVPQDRYCRCPVCGGIQGEEVRRRAIKAQDISTIWSTGGVYGEGLRACGVSRWKSLLAADPVVLADKLQSRDWRCSNVTPHLIRRWQAHARSLLDGQPRWVGLPQEFPIPERYIVLDLEYTPETKDVWLIGARVVNPDHGDVVFSCWSDPEGNAQALSAMSELIENHHGMPVVTYNGRSADLPMLRAVAGRCDASMLLHTLDQQHVDLYQWLQKSLMLPTLGLRLKNIMEWAGIAGSGEVADGFEALLLYRRYRSTGDSAIRDQLLDYNREDVDCVVGVIEHLRSIVNESTSQKYSYNPVVQAIDLVYENPFLPQPVDRPRSPAAIVSAPNTERVLRADESSPTRKSEGGFLGTGGDSEHQIVEVMHLMAKDALLTPEEEELKALLCEMANIDSDMLVEWISEVARTAQERHHLYTKLIAKRT